MFSTRDSMEIFFRSSFCLINWATAFSRSSDFSGKSSKNTAFKSLNRFMAISRLTSISNGSGSCLCIRSIVVLNKSSFFVSSSISSNSCNAIFLRYSPFSSRSSSFISASGALNLWSTLNGSDSSSASSAAFEISANFLNTSLPTSTLGPSRIAFSSWSALSWPNNFEKADFTSSNFALSFNTASSSFCTSSSPGPSCMVKTAGRRATICKGAATPSGLGSSSPCCLLKTAGRRAVRWPLGDTWLGRRASAPICHEAAGLTECRRVKSALNAPGAPASPLGCDRLS
mmetsp:Transcript_119355/g.210936  ORF Transcript_119355/g.210936 Transcript_119355/m.210936 type:complete len:286 (+) Transcript_119355:1892-2749(+)